ncbi:uncharacterized conserved protein ucp028035 protein [Colletotrichum incanum]|uniref:Uncharacterized conserved protein ucp028035 protein n=1 Tax=Colletotrichum incanum TaxID=1573173 RepID=A0A166VXW5_COLIC|nr:uncharacterized conserved protein ucp028035 protein [Colletotrichum incanum]
MAIRNAYISYKRDTRCLLYWKSLVRFNTSGTVTIDEFAAMTRLIGEEMRSVPFVVLELLRSVISARAAHWDEFQQYTEGDTEVEKSHAADRTLTIALYKTFEAFGALCAKPRNTGQEATYGSQVPDAIEEIVLANKFSVRDVRTLDDNGSDDDSNEGVSVIQERVRKRCSMGKKGKRKKKAKTAAQTFPGDAALEKVPLDDYHFLRTDDELATEYAMAVCSYFRECASLRAYLQGIWHEVAYDGLNSVVAGALVQWAIGMVKQTESDAFADFPGRRTVTLGNAQKAEGEFGVAMHFLISDDRSQGGENVFIDHREYIMFDAYRSLVDFAVDCQQKRNGVPTKSMFAQIANWDPNFDLQQATKEEMLKWRRPHTIKWLYDLVNVYPCPVVQRGHREQQDLENIDWSPKNEQVLQKAILGLQNFGGTITPLAMQKPGTHVPEHILPHEVFFLQCIVDAFTISRGWSIDMMKGHVLTIPPQSFDPTREIELFLDRKNERGNSGCLPSLRVLVKLLEADEELHEEPGCHQSWLHSIKILHDGWSCLGSSTRLHDHHVLPTSSFSESHVDGLWEPSPFLCAVGLMDSVELAFRYSIALWDSLAIVAAMIHHYNMLVKTGYLTMPNPLHHSLQNTFGDSLFPDGKVPTYNFGPVLSKLLYDKWAPRKQAQKQAQREIAKNQRGIYAALDPDLNLVFRKKSYLLLYRDANWNIESNPDDDIEPRSSLAMLRISQTKQVLNSQTRKKTLEETDLIRRAKMELKVGDDELLHMANAPKSVGPDCQSGPQPTREQLLRLVKKDIYNDVCGDAPSSGINYFWVTIKIMFLYRDIERQLRDMRNPLYTELFRAGQPDKRLRLVIRTLNIRDEVCLLVMAGAIQDSRASLKDFVYWEDMGAGQRICQTEAPRINRLTPNTRSCDES